MNETIEITPKQLKRKIKLQTLKKMMEKEE